MAHGLVIRFGDRRAAYRFVAEVRRLYEVARWPDLEVTPENGGAWVSLPGPSWALSPLRDLATRYGGGTPAADDDTHGPHGATMSAREDQRPSR